MDGRIVDGGVLSLIDDVDWYVSTLKTSSREEKPPLDEEVPEPATNAQLSLASGVWRS